MSHADIDVKACLYKGLIGACGAIPATVCAHPFDVVKIRMQTQPTVTPWSGGIRAAVSAIGYGGSCKFSPLLFFNGLPPALQQKVMTRGPMFLASEFCTQMVQRKTGASLTASKFFGSFGSGFLTGSLAAVFEYQKVLASQQVHSCNMGGPMSLVKTAVSTGQISSLARRVRAAGYRNGMFDSIFFGMQHTLNDRLGSGLSYALAASTAVTLDYTVDVAAKRMMHVPPECSVDTVSISWLKLFRGHPSYAHAIAALHSGLSAKAAEFSVSYYITGTLGVYFAAWLKQMIEM